MHNPGTLAAVSKKGCAAEMLCVDGPKVAGYVLLPTIKYIEVIFIFKVNLAKVARQIGHFTQLSPRWTEFSCRFLS